MFAIVIQLGAILAVVASFQKRIMEFAKTFPKNPTGRWWNHPLSLVAISFVVTAVPCFIIDEKIGENLESLHVMGWALLIGGLLMWLIDVVYSKKSTIENVEGMTLKQAVVIGFAQIFSAAFPGTSRSMATIAGGQVMGLTRSAALEFSFFLSVPVMLAATGFKLLQFVLKNGSELGSQPWGTLAVGFVVSFIVAWLVIQWFLQWVRKHGFLPFAIYRIIAGAIVLYMAYSK
jgi:undecaprenyl-diphosphatase